MTWKDRKRCRKSKKLKRKKPGHRKDAGSSWKRDSPLSDITLLQSAAPAIEACGSIQRALRLGVIDSDPSAIRQLAKMVPVSRGGKVSLPEAKDDWMKVVREAAEERNLDLEKMKEIFRNMPDSN